MLSKDWRNRTKRASESTTHAVARLGVSLIFCLALRCADAAQDDPLDDFPYEGADACLVCHGPDMPKSAVDLFATRHGASDDPRAPMGGHPCESCHGPSSDHMRARLSGGDALPPVRFGQGVPTPVERQNGACLGCHESGAREGWHVSAHAGAGVSCAACHQVHVPEDRVFDALAQQQACFECHPRRRSDTLKTSSHPLRFGAMSCSGCHDLHAGDNDFLLRETTINLTCYTCHAEKRGPFLWEHAPASENCSLCHEPHGSNHAALLERRAPLLCQQCHSPLGHPSLAYTAEVAEDDLRNRFMLARGCLNCHSQVHGSNHPSGATLHR